ncbi:MAG: response regulator [Thermodesulfobacteriota bacterium]
MRTLIVEDDFIARRILRDILSPYGDCDIAIDGDEAIQAFRLAYEDSKPYDLICMDIMMPDIDGQEALRRIREIEKDAGIRPSEEVKVIMTTALSDPKNVVEAFYKGGATSYIVKPVNKQKFLEEVRNLGLIGG